MVAAKVRGASLASRRCPPIDKSAIKFFYLDLFGENKYAYHRSFPIAQRSKLARYSRQSTMRMALLAEAVP